MNKKNIIKSITKDFSLNIFASLLITGVMQILVYPLLAQKYDEDYYGTILTIMGIFNTISVSLGNTLNNTRLIVNSEYEKEDISGDFNLLLLISGIVSAIVISFFCFYVFRINVPLCVGITFAEILAVLRCYYCVEFRLKLNYKNILLQNVAGATGYAIGIIFLKFFLFWPIPFIASELLQLFYLLYKTKLPKESFKTTKLFKKSTKKYLILIITGLSTTTMAYLDRLVIFPSLGGGAVSTYTVASFLGKTLGIVMTPIAGVLLSYYSQKSFLMTKKRYWGINLISLVFGVGFVLVSSFLSPIVTKILYPSLYEKAAPFFLLANLAATISVLCQITQSAVLKYAPTGLQIIKELLYGLVYLICGFILLDKYGLTGFCIASLTANIVKLFILYYFGNKYILDSHSSRK